MRNKNWIEFNNNNIKNEDMKDKVFEGQPKKIKIYKEKKGKKGKTVTVISGFGSENTSQIDYLKIHLYHNIP